jgi:exopolysaccharide biosynthesis protein
MSNSCVCCQPTGNNAAEIEELRKLAEEQGRKDFEQDGKITQLFNMYRCEVKKAVAEFLEVMQESGELNDLLYHMAKTTQPYYSGISTQKKTAYNTDYYVTIVPKVDGNGQPMRWKLGIANDSYDGASLESTISFAHRKNATLAVNCGVFDVEADKPIGVLIKDGRIVQTGIPAEDKYQYLAIMQDGSFRTYHRTTAAGRMLADGATDVVCIFGSLINNGLLVEQTDLRAEPRQSIGVRADGSIVIVTVDGRKPGEDDGVSYEELALIHAEQGSVNAWILDGGGSTATVLRGVKQNDKVDYFYIDRPVNTFLNIEKENNTDPTTSAANDLGSVKQHLIEMITENINFHNGFIRLRGKEGYFAPGVEMYVNGEETRRSKMGMTIDLNNVRNSYFYISFRGGESELSNMFRIYEQGVYMQTYHGTTSERPNGPVGMPYFDETLNKPIWKGKSGWVDATGAAV